MSNTFKAPFTAIQNQAGAIIYSPMLRFHLIKMDKVIEVAGLLDTGASVNVLPYSLGVQLGLIWQDEKYLSI